jgi:alpha-galactosidase
MSEFEVLEVRFHFNGNFVVDGSKMLYCNGDWGVSHIEKDKISIPELEGHMLDHTTFPRSVRMHWLPYGAELNSGMRLLVDDKSCLDMIIQLGTNRVVDIYTELVDMGGNEESGTQYADEDVFALFQDENVMHLDHVKPIAEDETVQNGTNLFRVVT